MNQTLPTQIPMNRLATVHGGFHSTGGASVRPADRLPPPPPPPVRPVAANVGLGVAPDRGAPDIAALRRRGRAALDELLARHDRMIDGAAKTALAATIDRVAGQRYATVSRLFWHTDAAALAEARATGKPVLSLRMLGRLDEDLSCANSRFFRTILYADPAISALLRDRFVLHWSSERAVPRVTIDFGGGRKLERTITGNSIHYILGPDGHPIDALPGLYAPSVFRAELVRTLALFDQVAKLPARARIDQIRQYHIDRSMETDQRWHALGGSITFDATTRTVLRAKDADDAVTAAQAATMSKMRAEVPDLIAVLDIGPDPAALAPDTEAWTVIGQALLGLQPTAPAGDGMFPRFDPVHRVRAPRRAEPAPAPAAVPPILSAPARALVAQVIQSGATGGRPLGGAALARVIAGLERTVIADTAINEMQLRRQIHGLMYDRPRLPSFAELNRDVYNQVFRTPADDEWLGLLPRDVFTGLPGDGVVITR